MKTSPRSWIALKTFVVAFMIAAFATSCATKKHTDWNSRIGSYTYDQAVAEMGPPDKQATFEATDERSPSGLPPHWKRREHWNGRGFGHVGVGVSHDIGSGQNHSLKLTFNKDGRLGNWSKD